MDYRTFKNELENYYSYIKEINKLKQDIDDIVYEMSGCRGIDYSKIPMTYNAELAQERILELIELKSKKDAELNRLYLNKKSIEDKLSLLEPEDREICLNIVAKKKRNIEGYSRSGAWSRVKRELEKVLKD